MGMIVVPGSFHIEGSWHWLDGVTTIQCRFPEEKRPLMVAIMLNTSYNNCHINILIIITFSLRPVAMCSHWSGFI